jgi:NADH-quinone oxidoreductase subunit H
MWFELIATLIKIVVIVVGVLLLMAFMTWVERRGLAMFQMRVGPNRVGPFGLLQPIADGLKLLFKEDFIPSRADKLLFLAAPIISFALATVVFTVIPFGDAVTILGRRVPFQIADINIGVLFVLGMTSLGVYGIVLAGWSPNSKYPLMGGIRSSAQMISYELSLGLAVICVLLWANSLKLSEVVSSQAGLMRLFGVIPFPKWFVLNPVLFLAFLVFMLCGLAETNRVPFDLPEAESELVSGFHTEYGSMKFAMFFLGEYIAMIASSAMIVTLFFGGWHGPIPPFGSELLRLIISVVNFGGKLFCFLFFFVWVRATLPRLKYYQLMGLGWKVLLPLALVLVIVSGAVQAWASGWLF